MIVRIRSRDGLERIQVDDRSTVLALKQALHQQLHIPLEDMQLSKDPKLLTAKSSEGFR